MVKAKRAGFGGDDLGVRWFAQLAATLSPTLLIPLNEERVVHDRRDAHDAALSLQVTPDGYAADLSICLGLTRASAADVQATLARLGTGILAFLRERAPDIDPQPELSRYLSDGTLERHVAVTD